MEAITLGIGETVTITATVEPSNATRKTVTWTSSDANIATVDASGVVTALATGEATITATAGGKTAEAVINVLPVVTGEEAADLLEWFVGWPTLSFHSEERGNNVGYDFKLKVGKISDLSDVTVSIFKEGIKIATNTLKDPSIYNGTELTGSFYTNDIKETGSWYVEQISGALGEDIFDKLELRVVYNDKVYTVNQAEIRAIVGNVKNLTQYKGYDTIQAAIADAADGNVIVVAQGDYEDDLDITKPITLKPIVNGESTIKGIITIQADNVTIDGFKVEATDTTAPVIHMIDSDNVNIINNTVIAQGYASIGTSTGPARVTGKISGNTVTGMIIVGTDGELEVSNNHVTVTETSSEGICFWPVGEEAELTVEDNIVGEVGENYAQIKVDQKPKSVNGKTNEVDMLSVISEDNNDATVKLTWIKTVGQDYAEYDTIQAAIEAAIAGDTILVDPGSYEGNLEIDVENLTLQSVERHGAVIKTVTGFTAGNGYGGITVLADGVTIDGFKIEQGVPQAVIHTHDSHNVTASNNQIVGLGEASPRGIDIGYASAQSNSVTIEGNEFTDLNCGVYVSQGNDLTVKNNEFNNMGEGAVVFDGTWGNIDNIAVKDNEASDAEYLLYFFNVVGSVMAENNILTNTQLSNWEFYNETSDVFFPSIQAALDWSVAVDESTSQTHSMRAVKVANDSVYIGYIQHHSTGGGGRDVRRYEFSPPYEFLNNRGMSVAQPKGLTTDDRGYVYIANREGGGSYASEINVYNDDLTELITTFDGGMLNFGGIAFYKEDSTYYMYIAREESGLIHRYDVTDLQNISLDGSFGTNGSIHVNGGSKLRGITVDLDGTIFVADRDNNKVFRISPDLTETIVISVTRPMDIALFEDNAYITSYNGSNSLIKVVGKYDESLVEDILISTLDGSDYSRGTKEGWSGIDISDDGRIWLCDQIYSDYKDRLLVSTPLPISIK